MPRPKDFATKYEPKILAMDPAFASGFGWAILNRYAGIFNGDKDKPLVHKCGVIRPFANCGTLQNRLNIINKLSEIWQEDNGFSRQPDILVIEQPTIYPNSPANPKHILDLANFVGQITTTFSPRILMEPIPREWKQTKKKEQTQEEIIEICDHISLKNIQRDMNSIAIDLRHNAYDAIGLGIYALRVINKQIKEPELLLITI